MVEVSVVLPSKNEEETIGICISKIKRVFADCSINGEIIVADNSQDRTPVIAKDLGAELIIPDKSGYGYAYTCAFGKARGRYIVMGDADDTYDFLEMPRLLEPLEKDETDMVIGSRFKGKMEKRAMPWHHMWIGNPVLTWFLNLFYKAGVSDAHSGFRAIRSEALEKLDLRADGMEFASEMIIEAVEKGLRMKEVPISYSRRKKAGSKLSSFSDGWRHLRFMLVHAPHWLFTYPGFFLLLAGIFLFAAAVLAVKIGFTPGIHSMIAGSVLTAMGYQTVFFGFFSNIYRGRGLPGFFTLEKGATVGALTSIVGTIYVLKLLLDWVFSGFELLPLIQQSIAGFTIVTLGLQTFFSSFMLSIMAEAKKR